MKKIVVTCIFLFLPTIAFADTHYVSKTGSDTYPYTSWATAADSIQKGINTSSYGDTVRVGSGTYREILTMVPGIDLIGTGMDSCIIDGFGVLPENGTMIQGADSSTLEGFHIRGRYPDYNCRGILSDNDNNSALKRLSNNRISNFYEGIMLAGTVNTEISNNIFMDNYSGIRPIFGARGFIINNTFTNNEEGISLWASAGPKVIKNIITNKNNSFGRAISGDFTDSIFVENNLILNDGGNIAILLTKYSGSFVTAPIKNNTISGNPWHADISVIFSNEIKNNVLMDGSCGVHAYRPSGYSCNPQVSYNDLWNNVQPCCTEYGATIDTSLGGNIYLDPMFVGGGDYHLQYGSPCIDAGDPNIKDPDSSRSDIGCYGGRWGETFTYQDYPPKAPDSLSAISESTVIILSWKSNTESDLSHYLVYKDSVAWFVPDTSKIVGIIPKDSSVFRDHNFVLGKTYYYRVSAWDLTGHKSEYSDELEVVATSVDEYVEQENRPPMCQLSQNYPNPFNSSTVIWYYLPDVGYQPAEVEITIYNLLGKIVRALVKTRQYPGEQRVLWDGKDDSGDEVASGIYFYRLKVSGLDLVRAKKMVVLR